jgi:hypothetical protein
VARRNEDLLKRDDGLPRREETSLEKAKANADKTKAAGETGVEEMKARMEVFEEKLGKMDATGKTCLEKTEANTETCQKPREADIKTDLKEMNTTEVEANPEEMKSIAENQEVPKEEAAVETIVSLEAR